MKEKLENDLFVYIPITFAELRILLTQECTDESQVEAFKLLQAKLQAYKDELEGIINDHLAQEEQIFCE